MAEAGTQAAQVVEAKDHEVSWQLTWSYLIIFTVNCISQDAEEFHDEDIATGLMQSQLILQVNAYRVLDWNLPKVNAYKIRAKGIL